MEGTIDFTMLAVALMVIIPSFLLTYYKVRNKPENDPVLAGKRLKQWQDYAAELEKQLEQQAEALDDLHKRNTSLTNKINNGQRAPRLDMELNTDNLKSALPELFNAFSPMLPRWLQPIMKNEQISGMMIDYFAKNPEKAMGMLGKFFGGGNKTTRKTINKEGSITGTEESPSEEAPSQNEGWA